ncbi:probable uridine nucleosidase 2 [Papaver somniferum]|uniref:probable uridine nucleosidase 2 n=1 Tax=Papaver somniferum TaxID=3469 RepID=UPI000E6FAC58|nr:probable uridine nucleosidase 2 [Papaver somniferum]
MSDDDRDKLVQSNGKHAQYISKILDIYYSYHHESYNIKGVYLHDPATNIAAVDTSLFTYTKGVVRVQTRGITRGATVFYNTVKRFMEETGWSGKPTVKVAVIIDAPAVLKLVMDRLINS